MSAALSSTIVWVQHAGYVPVECLDIKEAGIIMAQTRQGLENLNEFFKVQHDSDTVTVSDEDSRKKCATRTRLIAYSKELLARIQLLESERVQLLQSQMQVHQHFRNIDSRLQQIIDQLSRAHISQ